MRQAETVSPNGMDYVWRAEVYAPVWKDHFSDRPTGGFRYAG